MSAVDPSDLRYIPLLKRLHTLEVCICHDEEGEHENWEEVDLPHSLTSCLLPLRHLRWHHLMEEYVERALPDFLSAYAGGLHTLDLLHVFFVGGWSEEEECDEEDYTRCFGARLDARREEDMTAALLSYRSLRRLLMSNCWLSLSTPAPASPALPHPESLHFNVLGQLNEGHLAMLLDASPHLQELSLCTAPLSYNFVPLVG